MAGAEVRALPYFKWYWQDWRANRLVQRMNYVEKGLYRELLDECWAEGGVPDDIDELADLCNCPVEVMANAWQVLSKCFSVSENGLLVNTRLEKERTDRDRLRLIRSKAGKKGGSAKSLNQKAEKASASKSLASARVCHIEEKRREENKEHLSSELDGQVEIVPKRKNEQPPYQQILSLYQEICGGVFLGAEVLNDKRKKNIKRTYELAARGKQPFKDGGLEFWDRYFKRCITNRHWCGDNDRGWKADLEFITREANVLKVLGV